MSATATSFDPLVFLGQDRITSGVFKGGYIEAPAGELNWYFANLGLLGFVKKIPGAGLKAYLDLYIANLTSASTIEDVVFNPDGTITRKASDSDDSYAATFLSLVKAYIEATNDTHWLNTNLPKLELMANRNLVANRFPNGLTYPYQDQQKYNAAFLEDNCEVYSGLSDFVVCLKKTGHTTDAAKYSKAMAGTLSGILSLFNTDTSTWWYDYQPPAPGDPQGLPIHTPIGTRFYPDLVSQVFTQAFSVPVPLPWETDGYNYLNKNAPDWPSGQCEAGKCDEFPWMLLGYVAAKRGDSATALRQVNYIKSIGLDPAQRPALTINELGWYQRTIDLLGIT